jgi:hypothetical protein
MTTEPAAEELDKVGDLMVRVRGSFVCYSS